jgi:hypothetical protein
LAYDCTGKPDGYHKDPNNPHRFIQCAGGKAFEFPCPEDLVFDETTKTCVFGSGTPNPNATTQKVETTPPTLGTTKPNTPSTLGTTKPNTPSTLGTTKPNTQTTPHLITTKETATHPNVTPTQSGTTAAQTTKGPVVTTQTATEAPKSSTNTLRIRHTTPPP